MNRLNLARRTQIISCLVEGNSIRSTERMTDTHRDTAMRLLVEVGEGCKALLDTEMCHLMCRRIFVGKKQKQVVDVRRHWAADSLVHPVHPGHGCWRKLAPMDLKELVECTYIQWHLPPGVALN
jgi:hypothetical protein